MIEIIAFLLTFIILIFYGISTIMDVDDRYIDPNTLKNNSIERIIMFTLALILFLYGIHGLPITVMLSFSIVIECSLYFFAMRYFFKKLLSLKK